VLRENLVKLTGILLIFRAPSLPELPPIPCAAGRRFD
jgi:hypothetical protein